MANILKSTIVYFNIFVFTLFLLNVKVFSLQIQNITKDTHVIGSIIDTTSRAGKEVRVVMDIAINDFNTKSGHNYTLYTRNSRGSLIRAVREGKILVMLFMFNLLFLATWIVINKPN